MLWSALSPVSLVNGGRLWRPEIFICAAKVLRAFCICSWLFCTCIINQVAGSWFDVDMHVVVAMSRLTHCGPLAPYTMVLGQNQLRQCCCLTAPSYYLNKSFSQVLWHSPEGSFAQDPWYEFENYYSFEFTGVSLSRRASVPPASDIRLTLAGNKIVGHSDAVGASSGAASTSSFST